MIRKEAWSFYRTSSVVRLCWELEEPEGPKVNLACLPKRLNAEAHRCETSGQLQGYLAHKKQHPPLRPP